MEFSTTCARGGLLNNSSFFSLQDVIDVAFFSIRREKGERRKEIEERKDQRICNTTRRGNCARG